MEDVVHLERYEWVQDYVWQKLDPALVKTEMVVREQDPYLIVDRFGASGRFSPFVGYLQIQKYALGVFRTEDIMMHFECSLALEFQPSEVLECMSYVAEVNKGRQEIFSIGPAIVVDLSDEKAVRKEIDRWVDATVVFIAGSTDLLAQALLPDSAGAGLR